MVAGDAFQKSTENEKGAEDDTLAGERNDHGRFDLDQQLSRLCDAQLS